METITQRRVAAGAAPITRPSAPSSVFDIGRQASAEVKKRKQPAERVEVDVDAIQIRSGVPIPEATRGTQGSKYKVLLDKMKPGDSVVLPNKAALSLVAAAKKLGVKTANRLLGDGQRGVWKL